LPGCNRRWQRLKPARPVLPGWALSACSTRS